MSLTLESLMHLLFEKLGTKFYPLVCATMHISAYFTTNYEGKNKDFCVVFFVALHVCLSYEMIPK
jgi:hypothetical protein